MWLAVIVGILFVAVAVGYWSKPAAALPSFMPGYAPGSSVIHFKHGLAFFILGILLFVYAWFTSGTKNNPLQEIK
jgi:hypothetical protein